MSLVFHVPVGDHIGLTGWLKRQEPEYGETAWFALVAQAIEQQEWNKAWKIAAHVSLLSHNKAYVGAKTAAEAAAALKGTVDRPSEPDSIEPTGGADPRRIAGANSESSLGAAFPTQLVEQLDRTVPNEWRGPVGAALGVDLADLESPEGLRALAASLERRELTRLTEVLNAGDRWAERRVYGPEAVPKIPEHEAFLDGIAKPGTSNRQALENDLGFRSAEEARLRKELRDLGMERDEYDAFVRRFANVVNRQMAISCGGDCPACDQYVVDPNWGPPVRWFARGLINTLRAVFFLASVGAAGLIAYFPLRALVRSIIGAE